MFIHRAHRAFLSFVLLLGSGFSALAQTPGQTLPTETVERIVQQAAESAAKQAAEEINAALAAQQTKRAEDKKTAKTANKTTGSDDSASQQMLAATQRLRIGSGAVGGNYFVLGELVGGAISSPPGGLPCRQGGTCGVPDMQSENITSAGSLANLTALQSGKVSSAFVQSDVAYWAYTGTGLFTNKDALGDLRAIASLYPEAIHIVIRKDQSIASVSDLRGKRVSVGARKSGTLLQSRLVLAAYQLSEDDVQPQYMNVSQSIEKMKNDELDAMFFSVGAPAPALEQLFTDSDDFTLLSLDKKQQQDIFRQGHYFFPYSIAADTYPNIGEVKTISVYALWLCSASADDELVYQMTKALWSDAAQQLLNSSFIGKQIDIEHSLNGIGIPLHDGAKKYYNEIGKRF